MFLHIRQFIIQVLTILLAFQLARLAFLFSNIESFSSTSFTDFGYLFFAATRFDLSAFAYANALWVLLYFMPGNLKFHRIYRILLNGLFVVVNAILITPNIADIEYFKFTKNRATAFVFDLMGFGSTEADGLNQMPQFLAEYWYWLVLWLLLVAAVIIVLLSQKPAKLFKPYKISSFVGELVVLLLFAGLTVLAARGGWQLKPISEINAAEYATQEQAPLVLNSAFTIMKSLEAEQLEPKHYFSEKELLALKNPIVVAKPDSVEMNKQNVVILILESFSKEYIGSLSGQKTNTPFLDSLIGKSLVFEHAYANGTQSIEAVPSIISGIPSYSTRPFIVSPYSNNQFGSITEYLRSAGYTTAFFHGGNRGTMSFDAFARKTNCEHLFDRETYDNDADYDGRWGIFDVPFMQYSVAEMTKFPEPFFSYIFTLSSHHPYTLPPGYEHKYDSAENALLKSVSYADEALRLFFEQAQKQPWYNNTLFVLTADHTGQIVHKNLENLTQKFEIPIVFYHPTDSLFQPRKSEIVAQQIDIMPTVFEYLNYKGNYFAMGANLLAANSTKIAITHLSGKYQAISNNLVLEYTDDQHFSYHKIDPAAKERKMIPLKDDEFLEQKTALMNQLKARIQIFNYAMIHNQLK